LLLIQKARSYVREVRACALFYRVAYLQLFFAVAIVFLSLASTELDVAAEKAIKEKVVKGGSCAKSAILIDIPSLRD